MKGKHLYEIYVFTNSPFEIDSTLNILPCIQYNTLLRIVYDFTYLV